VGTRAGAGLYKWNGESWSVVGGGVRSFDILVSALAVIDNDGPGPNRAALYVGGNFTEAGTIAAQGIARWDGESWSAMGAGLGAPFTPYQIESIAAIDRTGGTGAPTIHVGGSFLGAALGGLAQWDPVAGTWLPVAGAPATISALATFDDDGIGPESNSLYAAGNFTIAGGNPSSGVARLNSNCSCYANCDNSTTPPTLNVNDFICFNGRYAAGSSLANCDGSTIPPTLNVGDFICFLNKFAVGCP
jgi:hypothetical protein